MATLQELEAAFIKADDAGNTDDAAAFAAEIRRMRAEKPAASAQPNPPRDLNAPPTTTTEALTRGMLGNPYGITNIDNNSPLGGMAVDAGLEGGGAALGQVMGGLAPGALKPVGMAAGRILGGAAGNYMAQQRSVAAGEQDGVKYGQVAGAGVAAMIPGGNLAGAPVRAVAKEGLKSAFGNTAALATQTVADENRLPTAGELAAAGGIAALTAPISRFLPINKSSMKTVQKTAMQETVAAARAAGYVLPPSKIDPSFVNNTLESIAGKAATVQEAAVRNQEITNALAKRAIGIPADAPLSLAAIGSVRDEAGKVYAEIASLSPKAAETLEKLKTARFQASEYYKFHDRSADPRALKRAEKFAAEASTLEAELDLEAMAAGRKDLVPELKGARERIAKTYDVERALNADSGNVAASVLTRAKNAGKPLSGGLETIASTHGAFPQAMREASRVPSPGVGKTKAFAAAAFGGLGYGAIGAPGLAAAGLSMADGPARSFVLSNANQNRVANRFLTPFQAEGNIPMALRLGAMSAARNQPQM